MAYITGDRYQMTLLPASIEDYIPEDDPVRAYDAFVEALDFNELGIIIDENKAGANPYWPKALLKLLVYGYSYGIRSSRKLERATHHNLSFIWLTGNLKPDYRTIARFRKDNKKALKQVLKQCVQMCMKLDLIEGNTLFIDGSKIRANASLNNTWTKEKCEKYLDRISKNIDDILQECERIDKQEEDKNSLVKLKEELRNKEALATKIKDVMSELKRTNKKRINTTDPDCVKAKGDQGTKMYHNTQIAVDEKDGLIVNTDVVSQSNDSNQLSNQTKQSQEVLEKTPKTVCADSGYCSIQDIKELPAQTKAIVPTQQQVQKERNRQLRKSFSKDEFTYEKDSDTYICPEGKRLHYKKLSSFNRNNTLTYQANGKDCKECQRFGICTTSARGRKIIRLKDEHIKEQLEMMYNSEEGQRIYKLRKQKAELPLAHIKHNLRMRQILLRTKEGAKAEISLQASCYNITRMITLLGGISALVMRLQSI